MKGHPPRVDVVSVGDSILPAMLYPAELTAEYFEDLLCGFGSVYREGGIVEEA